MGNLLCLLIGVLITLATLGLAALRGVRPMAAASAYRNVAWRLGLEADTRGVSLQGQLRGRSLFVGTVTTGEQGHRSEETIGMIRLASPLALGLHVRPRRRRLRDRIQRRPEQPVVAIGHDSLDESLSVQALEPARLPPLFDAGTTEALLQLTADFGHHLEIRDDCIRIKLRRPLTTEASLSRLVHCLEASACSLERSRAEVDVIEALAPLVAPWQALASRLGLALRPYLPELHGTYASREVRVQCRYRLDGHHADVFLSFLPHPPLGLHIWPHQADPERVQTVGQDIQLGREAFDQAFIIKGYDPSSVLAICSPPAQQALLSILKLGQVELNDHSLQVLGVDSSPDTLEEVICLATVVADTMEW